MCYCVPNQPGNNNECDETDYNRSYFKAPPIFDLLFF